MQRKWDARNESGEESPKKPSIDDGPDLIHFIGALLELPSHSEDVLCRNRTKENWDL
jgi:hypothetical protein